MSVNASGASRNSEGRRIRTTLTSPSLWMIATAAVFGGLLVTTFLGVFALDAEKQEATRP